MPAEDHDQAAESLAKQFSDSWNNRDGGLYGDAYWPDAELVDPTGTIWDGAVSIARMHVALWEGPAKGTLVDAQVRRVRPLSPTLAVVDLEISVTGFAPPPPGAAQGPDGSIVARLKHVIEKRGGAWKILASQNTFVAEPPPPQ